MSGWWVGGWTRTVRLRFVPLDGVSEGSTPGMHSEGLGHGI